MNLVGSFLKLRRDDAGYFLAGFFVMVLVLKEEMKRYAPPVPLDVFEAAPFELSASEISLCLERIAEQQEFQDIQQTTTSLGTVFLYSTLY